MKEKKRATYAGKVSGKEKRWHRDLRGRFTFASETSRSPGDFSKEGKSALRRLRPSSLAAKALKKKKRAVRISKD
jgi:hypothetical protein